MKDYYKILEITKDACQLEIKKAYHLLVKKYHPDKNINNNLTKIYEEKIILINEAYDVLSDIKERIKYDLKLVNEANNKKILMKSLKWKLFSKKFRK